MKAKVRQMAVFALAATCTPGTVNSLASCQLQGSCDGATYVYDGDGDTLEGAPMFAVHQPVPASAGKPDANDWQTGSFDDPWIDFPGERTVVVYPNGVGTPVGTGACQGPYPGVFAYISPDPNPDFDGSNFTSGSGNPAEFTVHAPNLSSDYFDPNWYVLITNASCAQYYLRVDIQCASPQPGAVDAGTTLDAADDAALDGSVDAATSVDAAVDSATTSSGSLDAATQD